MSVFSMSQAHNRTALDELIIASENIERRKLHCHELWLLSCYIEPKVVIKLIAELSQRVKLTHVFLAFDMTEAYRIGPKETRRAMGYIQSSCTQRGLIFDWQTLATSGAKGSCGIVHSKGYAILQRVDGKVSGGALLIGSANLTRPGLQAGSNIELGYMTTRLGDLRSFEKVYDDLWDNHGKSLDNAVLRQNRQIFRFALFTSGKFLHKWEGNLRQMVGIKYQVINKELWAQLPPELSEDGFELSDTLTRQPLALKELPKREIGSDFTRNFTVETSLGRWCPNEVWARVATRDSQPFIDAFLDATTPERMISVLESARQRQGELVERKLIREVDPDHLDRWLAKIDELREKPERLHRLYTGYEEFELPFDAQCVSEIDDLYESLETTLHSRNSENWTTRKIRECIKNRDIDLLEIDEDAVQLIEKQNKVVGVKPGDGIEA